MSMDLSTEAEAPSGDVAQPAPAAEIAPPETAVEEPADTLDDDLRDVFRKAQTPRDEGGKFAPKGNKPVEIKGDGVVTEAQPVAEQKPVAPVVEAPRAWSAEDKAKWASLPPDVQKLVASRENELHETKTEFGRLSKQVEPLRQVFGKHAQYLEAVAGNTGMQVPQYLDQLMTYSAQLDRDPAGTIKALADMYQVDLDQLYDPLAMPPDPQVKSLQDQVAQLQRSIAEREQREAEWQERQAQAEQQRRHQTAAQAVEEFFSKNPDADVAQDEILIEVAALKRVHPDLAPSELLAKAYDRVSWVHEGLRTKRLSAQREADEKARLEQAKKAQRAAAVNVKGSAQPGDGDADPEADMRAIWRKRANR